MSSRRAAPVHDAVGVMHHGVEDPLRPAAAAVRGGHALDEPRGRMRDVVGRIRVVVAVRAGPRSGDVDSGPEGMKHVVAAGEQRLVGRRSGARAVGVVLRAPEVRRVRFVSDDDVVHAREALDRIPGVGTELLPRVVRERRGATCTVRTTRITRAPCAAVIARASPVVSAALGAVLPGSQTRANAKPCAPSASAGPVAFEPAPIGESSVKPKKRFEAERAGPTAMLHAKASASAKRHGCG